MELTYSWFNFSRVLAVTNFAKINSNEYYCPVGYNHKFVSAAGYYYYEDGDIDVFAGQFFSVQTELLNTGGDTVFIDCLTAVLNSPLVLCEAEKSDTVVSSPCSTCECL